MAVQVWTQWPPEVVLLYILCYRSLSPRTCFTMEIFYYYPVALYHLASHHNHQGREHGAAGEGAGRGDKFRDIFINVMPYTY